MTNSYSIAEARSRLPSIVDEAESGAEILITRRGKLVAAVVGLRELERMRNQRRGFGPAYREFLERYPLKVAASDEAAFDGVRGSEAGRKVSL